MITRIQSGGQTGADQGFLLAGQALGLETGGWAPRGYRTNAGPAPWLATFGVREHESAEYPPRTARNVFEAEATIIFGNPWSRGCELTKAYAKSYKRPVWLVRWPYPEGESEAVARFSDALRTSGFQRWNGAGNREEKNPGITQASARFFWLAVTAARQR